MKLENEETRMSSKWKDKVSNTDAGELGGWYNKTIHSLQVELHQETYINSKSLGSWRRVSTTMLLLT